MGVPDRALQGKRPAISTRGLAPSLMLGTGTFGRTSTTDSVTYRHLLNITRIAYSQAA